LPAAESLDRLDRLKSVLAQLSMEEAPAATSEGAADDGAEAAPQSPELTADADRAPPASSPVEDTQRGSAPEASQDAAPHAGRDAVEETAAPLPPLILEARPKQVPAKQAPPAKSPPAALQARPAAAAATEDARERELHEWLLALDGGKGALLRYLDVLKREFDSDFTQISAVRLAEPVAPGIVGTVDPFFWEVCSVKTIGHRLLFAKGIAALSEK